MRWSSSRLDLDDAVDLAEDRLALRHARLEQLLDARQTAGDVDTRDTARVEGTHRELRARLADRLRRDDADRIADLHQRARAQVPAVALLADAVARLAGQRRAAVNTLGTLRRARSRRDRSSSMIVVAVDNDLAGLLVDDSAREHAADELVEPGAWPRWLGSLEILDP